MLTIQTSISLLETEHAVFNFTIFVNAHVPMCAVRKVFNVGQGHHLNSSGSKPRNVGRSVVKIRINVGGGARDPLATPAGAHACTV